MEAQRQQTAEEMKAQEQHRMREMAELQRALQLLQGQLKAQNDQSQASHQGAASSAGARAGEAAGVQPALREFMHAHRWNSVTERNGEGWNLLHLAARSTQQVPGLEVVLEDLLRLLPAFSLAETTRGRPSGSHRCTCSASAMTPSDSASASSRGSSPRGRRWRRAT